MFNELAATDPWKYAPHTYAHVVSEGSWQRYAWLDHLSRAITRPLLQGGARIIVEGPPRQGKSNFGSVWVPPWYLEHFPHHRVVVASYGADLAGKFCRDVRNIALESDKVGWEVAEDLSGSRKFATTKGGGMLSVGAGGALTGHGANLMILDDVYKNLQQARSALYDDMIWNWWKYVVRSRLEPNASVLIIGARWTETDLTAKLKALGGWTVLTYPAIAGENDMMGRKPGEPLCPERYGLEALKAIEHDTDSYSWNAQYQQNPIPIEGGLIKRAWWGFYDVPPKREDIIRIVQFWDCAKKPGISNDYSVCATWAQTPAGNYLLDCWRDKVEAPQLLDETQRQFFMHKANLVVIEDTSNGSAVIQFLRQKTQIPVIADIPNTGDKEIRALAATPLIRSGRCFLPRNAPWVEDFIVEHERFPTVQHDDRVDTTSAMAKFFANEPIQPRVRSLG